MNLKGQKEKRSEILENLDNILNVADKENRDLSENENEEYAGLETDLAKVERSIEMLEAQEERRKKLAEEAIKEERKAAAAAGGSSNNGEEKELNKIGKRFMFTKAMAQARTGKSLDGVEAEMFQEAEAEVRANGGSLNGNIAVPSKYIQIGKRDLTIGTEGTNVRPLDMQGVIPILSPNPVVSQLGAQSLTGLVGNVQFPRHNGASTLAWEGETDANAETTPTFDKVELSPNRVGGFIDVSQTFIRQVNSFTPEVWVRQELNRVLALELDDTAISGTGTGSQPTGILNVSGIGNADIGTNGGAITYAKVLELLSDVDTANALEGSLHVLTTPGVKYSMMQTPKQSSGVEGNFIVNDPKSVLGYNLATSTQVPSNITKGTGTNLHAMIFGNFSEWMIGQWGGIDLLVDPFTQATNGLLRVVINGYFDMNTRHASSFSAIQDIDAS